MKTTTASLAFLVLALSPGMTRAQESADSPAAPDPWAAEISLSLNSAAGNEQLTVLTTELGITHLQTEKYEISFKGRYRYGRSDGEIVARNIRGSLNLDLFPSAGWSPFIFTTVEQDPFRKLDVRADGGAGIKRTFYQSDWDEVSLSGAVLYSYEQLEVTEPGEDGLDRTARWSWRARARHQFREGTRLEQVFFYQPAWDRANDYLIEAQTAGRLALTSKLAVTGNVLYQRDSTPAPDVEPDDLSISIGLSLAATW